jgi:glycosyltransferase involved in cell wall biosynthesis
MINKQGLSIIMPVYNEEKNIKSEVTKIISNIKNCTDDFEIIVINDGSADKSADIVKNLALQNPTIRIITRRKHKGYGAAIRNGICIAEKEWLLIMDADGQYEINDLKTFWQEKSFYDFIIGYRKKRGDNLYRRWLGKLGNLIANLFLKTDIFIKDVDCGFKLFKTKELRTIPTISNGVLISFEILYKLLQNKWSFTQLPVTHYKRIAGKSTGGKLNSIIQIILESFKLVLNKQINGNTAKIFL